MRELERVAEATMDKLWEHYEAGHLDESIGVFKSFDYSEEAVDFSLDPDSYYFPNHRDGKLVRPQTISDDKIPVLALENDRTYEFTHHTVHPLQQKALGRAGIHASELHKVTADLKNIGNKIATSGHSHGAASTYFGVSNILPYDHGITSKPALLFDVSRSEKLPEAFCASVALHELVHVAQILSCPKYDTPKRELRKELEAYAVQATLVSSLEVDYSLSTAMAGTVDMFRRKHLGKTEYEPTDFFIEELRKDPIVSRIWYAA